MTTKSQERAVAVMGGGASDLLRKMKPHMRGSLQTIHPGSDSGGNTEMYRAEYHVIALGDITRGMLGLMPDGDMYDIVKRRLDLRGDVASPSISLRNGLLLSAILACDGDVLMGIDKLGRTWGVSEGSVSPASLDYLHLIATMSDGSELVGEGKIDNPLITGELYVKSVRFDSKASLCERACDMALKATKVITMPSDMRTSLEAVFLTIGLNQAIEESGARIVAVINALTKKNESPDWSSARHVEEICRMLNIKSGQIDVAICNTGRIPRDILKKYEKKGSYQVEFKKNDAAKQWITGSFVDCSTGEVLHNELAAQEIAKA